MEKKGKRLRKKEEERHGGGARQEVRRERAMRGRLTARAH